MEKVLKAWLKKNQLTPDPNDYTAIVDSNGSINTSQILEQIIKNGSEVKYETMLSIVTSFNNMAAELVVSGYNVNTGLVHMHPVIKGAFYDKTWDNKKNSVYIAINQGAVLRSAISETSVEILGIQSAPMEIFGITDNYTGNTDGSLTKGRNAEIKGSYLKIDGDDANCGVYFTDTTSHEATKLGAADIVVNDPSKLMIYVPANLVAGEYELSVTTQYTGSGRFLKAPRTTVCDTTIVIS